jgi:hypothetical protein
MALLAFVFLVSRGSGDLGDAPAGMLLRLHELPPAYAISDDSDCGPFDFEDASPALAEFITTYRPTGCYFEYERLFPLPGQAPDPPLVTSLAVTTPSVQGAEAGSAIARELLGYATGDEDLTEVAPGAVIGDESKLFHVDDATIRGRDGRPGSVLFWRSGSILAASYVAGVKSSRADGIALRFARLQQNHIEAPTPYTRAQQDDTMVPLGNPAIKFPIYWLGRTFGPGHGLPATQLESVDGPIRRGEGPPGERFELQYPGVRLGIWSRQSWTSSPLNRIFTSRKCTKRRNRSLANRRLTIFAGYKKDYASCPAQRPNVYFATVQFGRTVVSVNAPLCESCIEGGGPWNSPNGMEAVARALRRFTAQP